MSQQLRFIYLSLANAIRDENTDFRLGLRIGKIISYFKQLRETQVVDAFFLTEGRMCRDEDGNELIDSYDIGYRIAKSLGMVCQVMPNRGNDKLSFAKICIYDPAKLFLLETRNYYPGNRDDLPSGHNFCWCLTGFKFHRILPDTYESDGQCKHDIRLIFNVGLIHANTNKVGRDAYFRMMINEFSDSDDPWIFPGDYNIFDEIQEEYNQLLEGSFINMAPDIGHTFIGFPHDVDQNGVPYSSSLDRVFINWEFKRSFGTNIKVTTEQIEHQGMRISDHSMMTIEVNFP